MLHQGPGREAAFGKAGRIVGSFPGYRLSIAVSMAPSRFEAVTHARDFPALLGDLAALGFSGVELAVRNPLELDVAQVASQLRQAGLEPVAVGTGQMFVDEGLSLSDPDPAVRKAALGRLRQHLDFAAALGCPFVIIGLARGRSHPDSPKAEALRRVREGLETLATDAESRQLRLLVEAINRYETDLLNTLDEAWELCKGLPNTALLADTFHMNIEEPVIEASLVRHAPHVAHVHLADSNRLAPGQGHIDFRSILSVLAAAGYGGWLSAEVVPRPDVRTAAAQTVGFIKALCSN